MSALGQKQTSAHVGVMSALPPKADIDLGAYPRMPCAPAGSDKTAATATLATLGNRRYEITCLFVSWVGRVEICGTYMRERSDNPILRAFRHVALSVRFRFLAILPAGVFFRASDFKVRTSAVVQARLLNPFFTI